jgi:HD-GYP domain-containing protein (c-di-GMP phosphodiesterase class II)
MTGGRNLPKLLNTILSSFMDLCRCDGGSIFTLRRDEGGKQLLVFESMVTRSIRLHQVPEHLRDLRFALDSSSMVGRTATERAFQKASFAGETSPRVDAILSYTTRNILSAPLISPRGDLVGVVQLLNKLPEGVQGFDEQDERLCAAIAGQAALAIENSMLLDEQEQLLEGFVNACVTAVEARDPVTSGHSTRVSDYTVSLAEAVSRTETGPLRELRFSDTQLREIRYAAMLHDIGKISVKEEVLNKEKKLLPWELETIRMRLRLMRANFKLREQAGVGNFSRELRKLEDAWALIRDANEPSVLPAAASAALGELFALNVTTDEGDVLHALTDQEGFKLSIRKGSLTETERVEIERHVTNSFHILKMVPWSRGLELVPEIAYRHHEKLDGSGYPCGSTETEIPVQSRMLTICDIYDALTADDRPYKRSLPTERALSILEDEVKHGKIDGQLFQVFVAGRIHELFRTVAKRAA